MKLRPSIFVEAAESPFAQQYACWALAAVGATGAEKKFFLDLFRPTLPEFLEDRSYSDLPNYRTSYSVIIGEPGDTDSGGRFWFKSDKNVRPLALLLAAEVAKDHNRKVSK